MRVSKTKAAANRDALLQAASQLFRERGIDGVGVAEVAKEAGLTHGALYAHFPSKDALAAEAFAHGFAGNMAGIRAWEGGRDLPFEAYVAAFLSTTMRDRLASGCPMAASASEAGRQGRDFSASFARAVCEMTEMVEGPLQTRLPAEPRRCLALATVAAYVGALAVARAVTKADPALADEVLAAASATLAAAHRAEVGSAPNPPAPPAAPPGAPSSARRRPRRAPRR